MKQKELVLTIESKMYRSRKRSCSVTLKIILLHLPNQNVRVLWLRYSLILQDIWKVDVEWFSWIFCKSAASEIVQGCFSIRHLQFGKLSLSDCSETEWVLIITSECYYWSKCDLLFIKTSVFFPVHFDFALVKHFKIQM